MAKITFTDKNKFAGQPLNQLTDANVNEIKASVNALYDGAGAYAVVTELPATIPPGVQLLYNGTMWRGLLEGESSLAAGTPWPVKGYKEYEALVTQSGSNDPVVKTVKRTIEFSPTWIYADTGVIEAYGDISGTSQMLPSEDSEYSVYTQARSPLYYQIASVNNGESLEVRSSGSAFNFYIQIKYYPPLP
jgi:hypothetical protein